MAILLLAHVAPDGPLRQRGFRAGVASLNREKASELWAQCSDIAAASDVEGLTFGRSPRMIESSWGRVEFLSADHSGHASSFDLAIADEMGLFPKKGRATVAGLVSSTSAKDGRFLAISVLGDSPLTEEMVSQRDDPSTCIHLYKAPDDCRLDDESAWHAANPGIKSGIKSISYMKDMARLAASAPSEQGAFRAFDLNQPGTPTAAMIVALDQWKLCSHKVKPDRVGDCFVGFDLGGSTSMTAGAAYWPESGRLDCWGAFGNEPSLADRGQADGVGIRYERMSERGELRVWPGRVTPIKNFLAWLAAELADETVVRAVADRYRTAEAQDALAAACVAWPMEWRAQGSGKDGSADIRDFQRAVEGGSLRPGENLVLESAISAARLRYDANGNPALNKAAGNARIDALAASVLAVGAGTRSMARPAEEFHFAAVAV